MKSPNDLTSLNAKQPDGLKPGGKPYTMMVVENKEFQRKQIVQIFESESYEIVISAENGREALDKLEKMDGRVDIITTNLDMPGIDGYALMYELKQKYKNLPVIVFISEDTTKGVMQDLISMGVADFILKPINRRVILERVRKAVLRTK